MIGITVLALVFSSIGPGDDGSGPRAIDRRLYEAVRAKAGNDPAALVKLSLWCEAHGLTVERGKHLMDAIGIDPANLAGAGCWG